MQTTEIEKTTVMMDDLRMVKDTITRTFPGCIVTGLHEVYCDDPGLGWENILGIGRRATSREVSPDCIESGTPWVTQEEMDVLATIYLMVHGRYHCRIVSAINPQISAVSISLIDRYGIAHYAVDYKISEFSSGKKGRKTKPAS